jgi:hypothetical protein
VWRLLGRTGEIPENAQAAVSEVTRLINAGADERAIAAALERVPGTPSGSGARLRLAGDLRNAQPVAAPPAATPLPAGPQIPTLEEAVEAEIRAKLRMPGGNRAEVIRIDDPGSKVANADDLLPDALAQQRKMIVRVRIPADPAVPGSVEREITLSVGRGLESGQFGIVKPSSGQ